MKQRYDSYKPSGIDWIGEIPSHWVLSPIKHIKSTKEFAFVDGPFGSNLKSDHYIEEGDVYVIESGFITTGKFIYKKFKTITRDHFETIKRSECIGGDIIIAKIGYNYGMVGELPKLDKPSVVSGNSLKITLDNSKVLNAFFIYLMNLAKARDAYIGLVQETAQPALSLSGLNNFLLPLPPLSEQEAIVGWLDEKCGEIDAAIAKVDREIELIDELKQSEISRVVTRGLNPEAPLRPSGIDWIGDVPEHWEKCRFKNFMYLKVNPSVAETKVGLENLEPGSGKYIETDTEFEGNGIAFTFGDILYGKLRPYLRKVWLAEFEGNAVGDFFVFRNHNNSNITFIKYLLLSDGFTKQADGSTFGAKMPRVSSEFILTLPYFLPPLHEQQTIADYLDKRCAEIDGLKEKLVKKREILKELRQAIISEVVTGKRKVI